VDSLTEDEKKVFDLVALRFLAVFYPAFVYESTWAAVECEEESFVSKGMHVIDKGWTIFNIKAKAKKKEEEETELPELHEGEEVEIIKAEVLKNKTKPPQPYTEATLLTAMENAGRFVDDEELKEQLKESGLGTPATRAAIIERLITVGYAQRKGKSLVPTEKGKNLIRIVPEELKSPQTTGKWEKGLSSIAKGKMQSERFMGSIERFVYYIIGEAQKGSEEVKFEKETRAAKGKKSSLGKCPMCGKGEIYENTKAYFCTEWKNGCKFTLWKNVLDQYGNSLDSKKMKKLLKEGRIDGINVMLPQTQEKGTATLFLNKDKSFMAELMNFKREQK